ncbi:MAG: ComEC/Rec2 family competence protein, partial [Formivibrio sp.]|nr:ComEC/Rec2 family competence protein [Formivibrio sp.]
MLLRYLVFVFALVAGICVLQYLPRLPPLWPFCVLVLMCAGIAWRWRRGSLPLLIIAFFAAGVGYASVRAQWRLSEWLTPALEGQVVEAEGYVCDLPQTTHFGSRFLFVPTKLITADAHLPSKIQVQWYGDKQRVQAGERWRLVLKAKRPHGQVNPGGFDLESWFLQQNIGATASVQFGQKLDGTAGAAWLARLRSGLRDKINAALPEASYSGVVVALTVGDQSGIPQEQWKRFAATGVTHLISISGLHITLLAGLAIGLVNRGWRRVPFLVSRFGAPRAALIAGMITALGYSALAGMAVPTQRTLLMLVTAGVCLWRARPAATSAIWATALLAVVLIDPFAVLAVGFWLSFLTVGALLWVGGNRLAEGPKWQGWLTTQTAATIGSAPILLVVFGQLPLLSPIANAFAIPVVSMLVTPLALVGLLDPTGWVLRGAERLFAVTDWVLMQCAALPVTSSGFMSPPLWSLAPA